MPAVIVKNESARRVIRQALWHHAVDSIGEEFSTEFWMWSEDDDASHEKVWQEASVRVDVFQGLGREIAELRGIEIGGSFVVDGVFAKHLADLKGTIEATNLWGVTPEVRERSLADHAAAMDMLDSLAPAEAVA